MGGVPRRHHYVWRSYLEPWATEKGIWTLRRGATAPFPTNPKNVAVERDFYRLSEFQDGDEEFIRQFAIAPIAGDLLRKLNEGWISRLTTFFGLIRRARSVANGSPAVEQAIQESLIQMQEQEYSMRETRAVRYFNSLVDGDLSFLLDDANSVDFLYFTVEQYFRTKAVRERMKATFESENIGAIFERTWPAFRSIFATNVAFDLYQNRNSMPARLLEATVGCGFLAGDQPLVNVAAMLKPAGQPLQHEDFELFYPVSPKRALIFSGDSRYAGKTHIEIDREMVDHLNRSIVRVAHEQIYSSSEAQLKALAGQF